MLGRRKRKALKPLFILNVITAFNVSLLIIRMYFLENCKGHLFYEYSFQNIQICYHSAYPVMYNMVIYSFFYYLIAPAIKPTKPEFY